jgi:hypothetical protein
VGDVACVGRKVLPSSAIHLMSRAEWESVTGRAYNKLCVEERKTKITQAVAYIQQYLRTDLNKNISDSMSCGGSNGLEIRKRIE